uniref:T cell immunoglobulin and mucin domain containing 4 n=1 Tax=Pelusios castaneus TaxID=367368 RepID=A0A8C8RGK5_9SAUR
MACSLLLHWIILQLFIAHSVSDTLVEAWVGQSVRLPCTYGVRQTGDLTDMCWGQGICPSSKCNGEIARTDGWKTTFTKSERYHLKGQITRGDVSLTISNVSYGDRGKYCCRIEIPGLFNDIKRNLNLKVHRAITTPPPTTTNSLPTTIPSPTTILQTTTVWVEDGFNFSTTELLFPTAVPISEGTENADSSLITEGAPRTGSTTQTFTLGTDEDVSSQATDSPCVTGTVSPVTVQAPPETSEVNAISNNIFPMTPSEDLVKEELSEEPSTEFKLQSEGNIDDPKQHLENKIPTIVISVVVPVTLLFTSLLVVLVARKCLRKYQLPAMKSSDSSGAPDEILGGVEEENNPLFLQQIPDCQTVPEGTHHSPVESCI